MTYDTGQIPRFLVHESIQNPDGSDTGDNYYTTREMKAYGEMSVGHRCVIGLVTTRPQETLMRTDDTLEVQQWLKDETKHVRLFDIPIVLSEAHVGVHGQLLEVPK